MRRKGSAAAPALPFSPLVVFLDVNNRITGAAGCGSQTAKPTRVEAAPVPSPGWRAPDGPCAGMAELDYTRFGVYNSL